MRGCQTLWAIVRRRLRHAGCSGSNDARGHGTARHHPRVHVNVVAVQVVAAQAQRREAGKAAVGTKGKQYSNNEGGREAAITMAMGEFICCSPDV